MDLRQLRSFVAVAEERQFTRAAARLGIAQSSLSAQIRLLEAELGTPVLARTTRHVSLTAAGELLLERSRDVLADIADMTSEIERMSGMLTGRVLIGITPTPGPIDIVALLVSFSRLYPSIELRVREELSRDLAEELREDRLDVAILSIVDPADTRGLALEQLAEEELVVIVPDGHRLARRSSITVADLHAERLVASPTGATIRKAVGAAARDAGVQLDVGYESRETARLRSMVAAGLGVGVLPRSDAAAPELPIRSVGLTGPGLTHRLSLGWRAGRRQPPAARALLAEARRIFLPQSAEDAP